MILRGASKSIDRGADSVNVSSLPIVNNKKHVYPGYVNGTYTNYNQVVTASPDALHFGITPWVAPTDCLDVEPGDATPPDGPGFMKVATHPNLQLPMFYGSLNSIPPIMSDLSAAGYPRQSYFIWTAHPTGVPHICGPKTCGQSFQADATQWAFYATYDADLYYSYIFKGASMPESQSIPVIVTWEGADGLVSRKTEIPRDVWDTLKWENAS